MKLGIFGLLLSTLVLSNAALANVDKNVCGALGYTETNYSARNNEDVYYSLSVSCDESKGPSGKDFIRIDRAILKSGHKGTVTRFMNKFRRSTALAAAKKHIARSRAGTPFCMAATLSGPVCNGNSNRVSAVKVTRMSQSRQGLEKLLKQK